MGFFPRDTHLPVILPSPDAVLERLLLPGRGEVAPGCQGAGLRAAEPLTGQRRAASLISRREGVGYRWLTPGRQGQFGALGHCAETPEGTPNHSRRSALRQAVPVGTGGPDGGGHARGKQKLRDRVPARGGAVVTVPLPSVSHLRGAPLSLCLPCPRGSDFLVSGALALTLLRSPHRGQCHTGRAPLTWPHPLPAPGP